jgi:predicted acyl esterase
LTKQVEITNRDGHILRGIVNIPEDGTRFPAIVNVHGFTGNKSGYKSIYTHTARLLAEHGFASVRFDLYGNGESDGVLRTSIALKLQLNDMVTDLLTLA